MRAYDLQEQAGTRFTELSKPIFEAVGMATIRLELFQDREGAVEILDGAVSGSDPRSTDSHYRGQLEFAVLYAKAGRPDRARERLAAFRAEVPVETLRAEDELRSGERAAEAAIALAEGKTAEAIRLHREAREMVAKCKLCNLPELAEAFETAAMPDSALAVYESYLETRDFFRSQRDNLNLPRVLLGLGRSHEALGDRDQAAVYYRWLLDLWAEPDAALVPRVEELRLKLEGLG